MAPKHLPEAEQNASAVSEELSTIENTPEPSNDELSDVDTAQLVPLSPRAIDAFNEVAVALFGKSKGPLTPSASQMHQAYFLAAEGAASKRNAATVARSVRASSVETIVNMQSLSRAASQFGGSLRVSFTLSKGTVIPGHIMLGNALPPKSNDSRPVVDIPLSLAMSDMIRGEHGIFRQDLRHGMLMMEALEDRSIHINGVELHEIPYVFSTAKEQHGLSIGNLSYQLKFPIWSPAFAQAHLTMLRARLGFRGRPIPHLTCGHSPEHKDLGDYTVQKPIGGGAQGKVAAAYHRRTNTAVASKHLTRSKHNLQDISRELAITRMLKHPNIVALHGTHNESCWTNENGGIYFMLFPLCENALEHLPIDVDIIQRRKLMVDGCSAIVHIHGLGIMHRDVKPLNMLYHYEGDEIRLVLTDFGHATLEETSRHHQRGTVHYLAPEIVELRKVAEGNRSRKHLPSYGRGVGVWSTGLTFMHLWLGRAFNNLFPSRGGITQDAHADMWMRLKGESRVPQDVRDFIFGMVEWDAQRRTDASGLQDFIDKERNQPYAVEELKKKAALKEANATNLPKGAQPHVTPNTEISGPEDVVETVEEAAARTASENHSTIKPSDAVDKYASTSKPSMRKKFTKKRKTTSTKLAGTAATSPDSAPRLRPRAKNAVKVDKTGGVSGRKAALKPADSNENVVPHTNPAHIVETGEKAAAEPHRLDIPASNILTHAAAV